MRRLVALALLVLLPACGISAEDAPRTLADSGAPTPTPSSSPQLTGGEAATVFFVRSQDQKLRPTERKLTVADPQTLLQSLMQGPDEGERLRGLSSGVVDFAIVPNAPSDPPGLVTVAAPESTGTNELLAFGQVVCTLSRAVGVTAGVVFVRDGKRIQVPGQDGRLLDRPLLPSDFRFLTA